VKALIPILTVVLIVLGLAASQAETRHYVNGAEAWAWYAPSEHVAGRRILHCEIRFEQWQLPCPDFMKRDAARALEAELRGDLQAHVAIASWWGTRQ
jgi:hypothetical protein